MAKTFYPANNAEFLIWLDNFVTVADSKQAELGLSAAQVTALQTLRTDFGNQLNDQAAKKEASTAATTLVNGTRKTANSEVGALNAVFKASKTISADLIEQLGLNANSDSLVSSVPVAPEDLVVSGFSNGTNSLKWASGGNKPRTNYIVEAKIGDAADYAFVAVSTKLRYEHKNQTPGVRVFYRVKAVSGDLESAYSNVAVIYN